MRIQLVLSLVAILATMASVTALAPLGFDLHGRCSCGPCYIPKPKCPSMPSCETGGYLCTPCGGGQNTDNYPQCAGQCTCAVP